MDTDLEWQDCELSSIRPGDHPQLFPDPPFQGLCPLSAPSQPQKGGVEV